MSSLRKKPWNRVNQPVYSIASAANDKVNMNICSYVTAVSMQPKRFIVAIFKNTLTLELVKQNPQFVLQFLAQEQYKTVPLLGKKSGYNTDKLSKLKEPLDTFHDFTILANCLAVVELSIMQWIDGGDHWCALCDVVRYKNLKEGKPLTLDYLREKKIISA
jgi:flavin reductase (DIM6/NTAB) family NADH-FMN oxidoreductase RutF